MFKRLFIELDDDRKGDFLVVKWDDDQIRKGARINVDPDYAAVFINRGHVAAVLPPGAHTLDFGSGIISGRIVDAITDDRLNELELFFVSTRPRTSVPFGGPVDTVRSDEFVVSIRVFGEFAFRVANPRTLMATMVGTTVPGQPTTDEITSWVTKQVLAAVREEVPPLLATTGVINVGATQDDSERLTQAKANLTLAGYGLEVTGFGQFHLNADEADLATLKEFVARQRGVELAGGFDAYVRGEALLRAADSPGAGGESSMMTMALLTSMLSGRPGLTGEPAAAPALSPVPVSADTTCRGCAGQVPPAAKFCPTCGGAQQCAACQHRLGAAKFCPECGVRAPDIIPG